MKWLHSSRFHLCATLVWLGLSIPTLLWWMESIAWVVWMSLYAIVVTHWSAYQAARAEDEVKRQHGSLETS